METNSIMQDAQTLAALIATLVVGMWAVALVRSELPPRPRKSRNAARPCCV